MTPALPDLGWLRKEAVDLSDEDKTHAIILLIDALEETRADLRGLAKAHSTGTEITEKLMEERNELLDKLMQIKMGL
jgi:hypothetical protein